MRRRNRVVVDGRQGLDGQVPRPRSKRPVAVMRYEESGGRELAGRLMQIHKDTGRWKAAAISRWATRDLIDATNATTREAVEASGADRRDCRWAGQDGTRRRLARIGADALVAAWRNGLKLASRHPGAG